MNGKSAKKAQGLRSTSTVFSASLSTGDIYDMHKLYLSQIWRKSIHPVWSTGLVVLLPACAPVIGQYLLNELTDSRGK